MSKKISKVRKRRKAARPAEILEAGFREFAENGFHATKLEHVAKRADIAKGTLYLYFDSKETLFKAAVRSRIIPFLDRLLTLIDYYPGSTKFLLKKMFKAMYRKIADPDVRTIMKIIIAEGDRFPELSEFYYKESISKITLLIEKVIKRGIDRGELRQGAATQLPQVLIAPGIMAAIWQSTFSPYKQIPLEQFLQAHLDLLLHGISKQPEK